MQHNFHIKLQRSCSSNFKMIQSGDHRDVWLSHPSHAKMSAEDICLNFCGRVAFISQQNANSGRIAELNYDKDAADVLLMAWKSKIRINKKKIRGKKRLSYDDNLNQICPNLGHKPCLILGLGGKTKTFIAIELFLYRK